ncbi:MAG: sulfatase [Planctomycetaceae bacterium]
MKLQMACWLILGLVSLAWGISGSANALEKGTPPNVVIIFCDDLGYGDIEPFGAKQIKTPHLAQMASEGRKFTNFYVPQAVCSASRTGLLTGCYPNRVGIYGALGPNSKTGISDKEQTLAELLHDANYRTAIFGKWHLGDKPQFLPTKHGFDQYYGLPYSNDMWPKHPTAKFPDLPLIEDDKVIQVDPDQRLLTAEYTRRAVEFVSKKSDQPFFLYLPHTMPHVPLFVPDDRKGKSAAGLYGDVIEQIDWSVGQVLQAIKDVGKEESTIVIFTSDNGPWLSYGNHAGSSGGLREGKGTSFEGGVRVPCLVRWPKTIAPGTVCDQPLMTIDLLPTLVGLTRAKMPELPIDGKDNRDLLLGTSEVKNDQRPYWFYWGKELHAVRKGKWKLHLAHPYIHLQEPGKDGQPGKLPTQKLEQALFDLESDPAETKDVAGANPEVVAALLHEVELARAELGDSLVGSEGNAKRPSGVVE